jgi:hypothetical protein
MSKSLFLVAPVCALLAICSSAFAASPAAYRAKVNGLCKVGIAKMNAVPEPSSRKGYGAYFAAQARLGTQLLQQIIAVKPPTSLQPLVLNALRPQGKVVGIVVALRDQVRKGADPLKAFNAVSATLKRLTVQADAAWRRAGLNACVG